MILWNKLFQRKSTTKSEQPRTDADLWSGVPEVGRPMDAKPHLLGQLSNDSWRENHARHALVALAISTDNFNGIGKEGFYMFDLSGDATIVCKLSDSTVQQLEGGCDLCVETFQMPTYPILRVCLDWERRDGQTQTFENIPDIAWADIQRFFSLLIRSSRLLIHAVESEAPIPRFTAEAKFDEERCEAYRKEVLKAVRWYNEIREGQRDYQTAFREFFSSNPM
jgi:hypothetical protein